MKRPFVLVAVLVVLGAAYAFATRNEHAPAKANALDDIRRQVAADAIAQYQIAKRHGNACAQAGMVKAAVLQAQDEAAFAKWSKVERDECAAATAP